MLNKYILNHEFVLFFSTVFVNLFRYSTDRDKPIYHCDKTYDSPQSNEYIVPSV